MAEHAKDSGRTAGATTASTNARELLARIPMNKFHEFENVPTSLEMVVERRDMSDLAAVLADALKRVEREQGNSGNTGSISNWLPHMSTGSTEIPNAEDGRDKYRYNDLVGYSCMKVAQGPDKGFIADFVFSPRNRDGVTAVQVSFKVNPDNTVSAKLLGDWNESPAEHPVATTLDDECFKLGDKLRADAIEHFEAAAEEEKGAVTRHITNMHARKEEVSSQSATQNPENLTSRRRAGRGMTSFGSPDS